jgi:pimeloyl-ACP methyl ester carboxylesterase
MELEHAIRQAETRLFADSGLRPEESFFDLAHANVRLRVLAVGTGPPLVMLHGVSLAAAVWAPLLADLAGYRALLVDLPGHGLSGPAAYRPGAVREPTLDMMDDLLDALGLSAAPVVGHSLGGMFALWYAAARPGRIASLAAIGEPAVALPGVTVRMPLSLLTVPVLGRPRCAPPRRVRCTAACWARVSAPLPPRPRPMRWSMCSAWPGAARATPRPSPRLCTRSTRSAGPGQKAS